MAFKHGNQTLITIDNTGATQIQSASGKDIALYPDTNIWIKEGTKLIFEGTLPDLFEAKLQATSLTADRDIILPDSDGTLATESFVNNAVSSGTGSIALNDITNVDDSGKQDGYVLTWDNANSVWIASLDPNNYSTTNFNTDFATKTTADLAEGTSLYYTDERVDDRISNLIVAGTNITTTYDDAAGTFTINASSVGGYDLSSNTTTDLAEGTNLYYTDTRFDTRLATKSTTDVSEGTNLYFTDSRVRAAVSATNGTAGYDSSTGVFSIPSTTDHVSEGTNLYYTDTRFDTRLATKSTTDLAEGTNLYYTDARADARITNALGGNVTIGGDLTVSGTTTTVNSNTVNIGDSIITLNSDETGAPSQNGGIEIERGTSTNVQLRFNETSDAWEFTNDGTTYVALGTSATFTGTTDGITEGSTNLYYTDARFDTRLATKSTTDLAEGSNLYYTDTRARTHIEGADLDLGTNKILYSNVYATTGDLPTASSYHGMFAHVHGTGKGYYAHGGNWIELANQSDIPTNNNTLTNGAGYITSSGTATNFSSTTQNSQFNSIGVNTAASGTAGDIRATADVTAYYSSDEKLKENVVEIDNAINKVKQIRGVEFDWTQDYLDAKGGEDEYFVRKHDVGVIAQEIEAVLPEVVATREDGIKAVKYDRIVALLIEAIKEQQSEIEELKKKLG